MSEHAGASSNRGLAEAPTVPLGRAALACTNLLRQGDLLAETYEVGALLGEGGMGQVFEATDRALMRKVAIKVGRPSLPPETLFDEARALAAVRHSGSIGVFGIGLHQELPFVVMERIYGIDLASYLYKREQARDPFTIDEALELLARLVDALGAIHRSGIAHRDVKPGNVMLAPGGRVVMMDLGIAMAEGRAARERPSSGTLQYMAPETLSGNVADGDTFLVDVYALGVMTFEILTGELPFTGASPALLQIEHITTPPPAISLHRRDVPAALTSLVSDMLAKDPHDRPQGMDDVAYRIERIRRTESARATSARPSVLVVDDDRDILLIAHEVVHATDPDAELITATNAEEALRKIAINRPDLLMVDLQMPGMNGVELCMYLRGTNLADRTTIVAMSAAARTQDVRLLGQLGVRFVHKGPSFVEGLAEAVRAAGARSRR